jgi:PAS domain-containing protein
MIAFDPNIEAALLSASNKPVLSYTEGNRVDYLQIFNQAHKVGTWEYVIERQHIFWSPEVYAIHGLEAGLGPVDLRRAVKLYHSDDSKRVMDIMTKSIHLKTGFKCKLRLVRADGAFRIAETIGVPMLSGAGKVTRLLGTFRDVTSQTEFENIRNGQQDLLVRMIRCLPVAAALIDNKSRYIAWSSRWLSEFNLPEETNYLGLSHTATLPDVASFQKNHLELAFRGQPVGKDNDKLERANGVSHIADWRIQPWRDKTGAVGGALILFHVKYTGVPKMKAEPLSLTERSPLEGVVKLFTERNAQ